MIERKCPFCGQGNFEEGVYPIDEKDRFMDLLKNNTGYDERGGYKRDLDKWEAGWTNTGNNLPNLLFCSVCHTLAIPGAVNRPETFEGLEDRL